MTPEVVFRSPGLSTRRCPLARADMVREVLADRHPHARWTVFVTSASRLLDDGVKGGDLTDEHETERLLQRWEREGVCRRFDDGSLVLLEPEKAGV